MILYGLVALPPLVLCEHAEKGGNFTAIAKRLVQQAVGMIDTKKSLNAQNTIFHYMIDETGMMYLCLADRDTSSRMAFSFLTNVQQIFRSNFSISDLKSEEEYALNDVFAQTIKDRMYFFNTDPSADKYKLIQTEINSVKKVMVENIDKVLERGDKIEVLVTQTAEMENQAFAFKKSSVELQRALWFKNVKLWICIVILVIFIICVLIFIALIVLWQLHFFDGSSSGRST